MLKNKLVKFIAKRVLICYIILSIIDLIWVKQRWVVLAGLSAGSILSVLKFSSYSWILNRITSVDTVQIKNPARSSMLIFLINQAILFPVLLITYFINTSLFTGIVVGISLVPFVIMVNSITTAFGITKNIFE